MSQRRKRSRVIQEEEEEEDQPAPAIGKAARGSQAAKKAKKAEAAGDEEYEGTQGKAAKWASLSPEEREKLVGDFMRLVLFQDHNKHPTRRQDINKLVLQEYKGHNLASNLLAEAQKRFQEIFGFELIEVRKITVTANLNEKGKAPKIKSTGSASGVYVLRNMLGQEERGMDIVSRVMPHYGLLMVVLGLIHLNEGVIDSDTLYAHLKNLGLSEGTSDPVLGDWKKLLDVWVKEMYLHRAKGGESATGSALVDYRKGPRAFAEIDTQDVLAFIAGLYGDEVDPIHAKEVEATEKPRDKEKEAEEDDSDSLSESESD